jgi:hypothetical protein
LRFSTNEYEHNVKVTSGFYCKDVIQIFHAICQRQ